MLHVPLVWHVRYSAIRLKGHPGYIAYSLVVPTEAMYRNNARI